MPMYQDRCIALPDFMMQDVLNGEQCAVFMNMQLTHDNAMVMSRSLSERFKYVSIVRRTIYTAHTSCPIKGDVIEPYDRP